MKFVNVGALDGKGNRFKTKKAMKDALKADQDGGADELIAFDQTAMMQDGSMPGIITAIDIPDGVQLVVVGPDPYNSRKWYANVERKNGELVVK